MSPRDVVYVGHMLDMARKAVSKTQGLSREAYDADENLRLALIHLVQVIGEAARRVSRPVGPGSGGQDQRHVGSVLRPDAIHTPPADRHDRVPRDRGSGCVALRGAARPILI